MGRSSIGGWLFRIGLVRGMMGQAKLAWHLFQDRRVPTLTKGIPVLALLYVISPIDLALDWIPVIGQMDDIAIVGLGLQAFIRAAPQHIVAEYQAQSQSAAQAHVYSEQERQPVRDR